MAILEPKQVDDTFGGRLRQYRVRLRTTLWAGAGLIALIPLVNADLADGSPAELRAACVTVIILGGGAFAFARIGFEWESTLVERAIEDAGDDAAQAARRAASLPQRWVCYDRSTDWPHFAEFCYYLELLAVAAAATLYLISVWWAATATQTTTTVTITTTQTATVATTVPATTRTVTTAATVTSASNIPGRAPIARPKAEIKP